MFLNTALFWSLTLVWALLSTPAFGGPVHAQPHVKIVESRDVPNNRVLTAVRGTLAKRVQDTSEAFVLKSALTLDYADSMCPRFS